MWYAVGKHVLNIWLNLVAIFKNKKVNTIIKVLNDSEDIANTKIVFLNCIYNKPNFGFMI